MTNPIGIDFGGSGIKAAPVDLGRGAFVADRERIPTPVPSTPEAVADVMDELVSHFPDATGPVGVTIPGVVRSGVTIPGVVRSGVVHSAANIDKAWMGTDADALLTKRLGRDVHVVNDADAAGVAELRYGAARGASGLVILTTLGTGIGSALLHDGVLVPNSELGHLEIDGHVAEKRAAASIRTSENLSWDEYAARLTTYYRTLEKLFSPDLFVVGGGISRDAAEFLHLVDVQTRIVPATLRNRAGIIGAAVLTSE
jgi:polyphosphate glucokinase